MDLRKAIAKGDSRAVEALLKAGANVNEKPEDGIPALHVAARSLQPRMVELLVDYGANVDLLNDDDENVLHAMAYPTFPFNRARLTEEAIMDLYETIISCLIEIGAAVNAQNNLEQTPLHLACMRDGVYSGIFAHALLKYGADINIKDETGRTPFTRVSSWNLDLTRVCLDHVVKLKCLYEPIDTQNSEFYEEGYKSFRPYVDKISRRCEEELLNLRKVKYECATLRLMLYMPMADLEYFVKYKNVREEVEKEDFEKSNPLYGHMLKNRINQLVRAEEAVNTAEVRLQELSNWQLPILVTHEIVKYLHKDDIRNLVNVWLP